MNIFKNKINQREYAYIFVLLTIALSYIYRFSLFDIHHLKDTVDPSLIIPKIISFIILSFLLIVAFVYVALIRVNDTKISKWSLVSLLVPYLGMLYSFALLFLPSVEKTSNNKLAKHITITSILIVAMNTILFGFGYITFGSVFLILLFLLLIFIIDFIMTNVIRFCKKKEIGKLIKISFSTITKNGFNLLFFATSIYLSVYSAIVSNDGECHMNEPSFVISKLLVFITSVYLTYKFYKKSSNSKLMVVYLFLAVIFNPIYSIPFSKYQWVWAFLLATIIFILNGIFYIKKNMDLYKKT